jgi:hypothetical protein
MKREERAPRRAWRCAAVALLTVLLTGRPGPVRADDAQPAQPPPGDQTVSADASLVTVTAKVLAIDLKNRLVTLKGPVNTWEVEVGPEVQRLSEVKVGDNVVIKYYEAIAISILKPEKAKVGVVQTEKVDRAVPGERPAGLMCTQTTMNMKVLVVNLGDNSVTLQGPKKRTEWIKVKDPDLQPHLKDLQVGDIVQITYDEALAMSVEESPGS